MCSLLFRGWVLLQTAGWCEVKGMVYEGEGECYRRMEIAFMDCEDHLDWVVLPVGVEPIEWARK